MRHEIPTHLEVQDRFIGNLTTRQLLYLGLGAALGYGAWLHFQHIAWFGVSVAGLIVLVALTVACVRPQGRDMEDWLLVMMRYVSLPKRCVWRRRVPRLAHDGIRRA
jgi:hypothetical protein